MVSPIAPPPVATGTSHSTTAATSGQATMSLPATAGNILVAWLAIDKSAGTINSITGGGAPKASYVDTSVSAALWVWTATGGETSHTFTWTTSQQHSAWVAEYEATSYTFVTPDIDYNSGSVAATSSGPVTSTGAGFALAFFANDSSTSAWATTPATPSTGWTTRYTNPSASGAPGLAVAEQTVAGSGTQLSITWTPPTTDQAIAAVLMLAGTKPDPAGTATLLSSWVGGATQSTAAFRVKTSGHGSNQINIAVSTASNMSNAVSSTGVTPDANGVSAHRLTGLAANTLYYYRVWSGAQQLSGGQFHTMPAAGIPTSFSFAFGSCRSTVNASTQYAHIRGRNPLFYHHTGDIQYEDINSTDPDAYRTVYNTVTELPAFGGMLANLTTYYNWDDHDFCGNNSNGSSTGKTTACQVYRERVPHGTLAHSSAIYQTWTAGRVRFVMLDCRSQRGASGTTMLGTTQLAWLQTLLSNETLPLTFICSSVPWTTPPTAQSGADDWSLYATERATVAGYIRAAKTKVVLYSGDMHALAADNGTNDPTKGSNTGIPIIHAASLGRSNSLKGGPYSQGTFPTFTNEVADFAAIDNYGWVDITDTGSQITVSYEGWSNTSASALPAQQQGNMVRITWSDTYSAPTHASKTLPARGAFYYPWFSGGSDSSYPGSWNQSYNGAGPYKPATQYHPTRGHYDSNTTSIIDAHITDLVYAKFDVAISSWWGKSHVTNTNFAKILTRAAAAASPLKWCIYYEPEGDKNTHDPTSYDPYNPTSEQIAADLTYLNANYFNHENYLWVDGKPVVFTWGNGADATATPPVIGDETSNPPLRWKEAQSIAGVSIFHVPKLFTGFTTNVPQPEGWHQYGPASAALRHAGYYTNLSPGFWHFAYAENPTLPFLARLDDATWRANIRSMIANADPWQLVTSFNEYGEGTAIEAVDGPALGAEYTGSGWGTAYLDALAQDGVASSLPGAVNLTGAGLLTSSGAPKPTRSVALSSSGLLTSAVTPRTTRSVALAGAGLLVPTSTSGGAHDPTVVVGLAEHAVQSLSVVVGGVKRTVVSRSVVVSGVKRT